MDITEIHINDLTVDVEPLDIYEGFATAIDVYGTSEEDAKSNAERLFNLLSEKTNWRIALEFDENDTPILERPEQDPGA
ncbi:hypothetical protein [Nocardiopsis rhodophaea]|uniref:hypothetical protein n=1 Tax=Nocardiopsis rhodophaea TaxID=280238 RepID=UPI0031DF298E